MKTVYTNSMVAHVWASQKQAEGRSGNGNFYFHGPALYSYGTHFVVGFLPESGVALLNSDGYSITTSGHKSDAWRATRHMEVFNVPGLTEIARYTLPNVLRHNDDVDRMAAYRKEIQDHVRLHASELDPGAACYLLALCDGPAKTPRQRLARIKRAAATFRRLQREAAKLAADKRDREAAREKADRLAYAKRAATTPDSSVAEYVKGAHLSDLKRTARELFHAQRAANAAGRVAHGRACWRVLKQVRAAINLDKRKTKRKDRNRYTRTMVRRIRDHFKPNARVQPGPALTAYKFGELAKAATWILTDATALGGLKRATFETIAADATARGKEIAEREARERFEREAAKRAAWLAGTPGYWHGSDENGRAYIRAVDVTRDGAAITGGKLETSHGADVPLTHAIKAFRFIKLCHDSGRAWHANGKTLPVGHFRIDQIDAAGNFRAGCHNIAWAEVERLARALGVFDVAADESALTPSQSAA